ncbi:hypothetical protein RJ639_019575 [Escallonia herrerae]|uniref:Uncharacterized protein n=1 Tax=Escallonia herrerae TaxID=1293975 RepID=A0AA88VA59_9ASTE|nr:hypothetical protein RJ639_019575 [Escallonia herrerae]
MENTSQLVSPGSRQLNLKRSFEMGTRFLLTPCSKEDFFQAFPTFTNSEQERLYRLFLQVLTSLRENAQDEFESTCIETQVGSTLDTVEQLVEEQNLDPLFPNKTNVGDTAHSLSAAKKNEIQYLTSILEKAEEQKNIIRARIELLKKEGQDFSGAVHVVEKIVRLIELTSIFVLVRFLQNFAAEDRDFELRDRQQTAVVILRGERTGTGIKG